MSCDCVVSVRSVNMVCRSCGYGVCKSCGYGVYVVLLSCVSRVAYRVEFVWSTVCV